MGPVIGRPRTIRGRSGRSAAKLTPMNMGGPTDHWYTDIFTWDRPAFGEPLDSLIRDIRNFGGDSLLQDDQALGRRLWDAWPQWGRVEERTLSQLAADLRSIRDDLLADAEARGWEVERCDRGRSGR